MAYSSSVRYCYYVRALPGLIKKWKIVKTSSSEWSDHGLQDWRRRSLRATTAGPRPLPARDPCLPATTSRLANPFCNGPFGRPIWPWPVWPAHLALAHVALAHLALAHVTLAHLAGPFGPVARLAGPFGHEPFGPGPFGPPIFCLGQSYNEKCRPGTCLVIFGQQKIPKSGQAGTFKIWWLLFF